MNFKQFSTWLHASQNTEAKSLFQKPLIMGVLNCTSDSFYDGGKYLSLDRAYEHAFELIAQGADIIDIGGESSRPGANPVPIEVELQRVIPIIEKLSQTTDICISIDTHKPYVMQKAVEAGAHFINDIYALREEGALQMAARLGVPVCLMHMQGVPRSMQDDPKYPKGLIHEIITFFKTRVEACITMGIKKEHIILDPGFGFGKLVRHNVQLIYNLSRFKELNHPILLGVSRKSTIGAILGKNVDDRLIGSLILTTFAALQGVGIVRTHDVEETKESLELISKIYELGLDEDIEYAVSSEIDAYSKG